jgi:hypothetical protein
MSRSFSLQLCQEAIELLVAQHFLSPSHTQATATAANHQKDSLSPTTAFSAFTRTLQTLSLFDWEEDPFIVDFSLSLAALGQEEREKETESKSEAETMNAEVRAKIAMRFRALRAAAAKEREKSGALSLSLPVALNPPMYFVSSCDKVLDFEPSLADKSPERVVLGLLVSASKATLKRIRRWLVRPDEALAAYLTERDGEDHEGEREELMSEAVRETVFHSEAVLRRCDFVLSFHRGITNAHPDKGPAFARLPVFANMTNRELLVNNVVVM